MDICVIGTGYVGLVAGTCLANAGHRVICVDKDELKIQKLTDGIIPIYEPHLEELIRINVLAKRLTFTCNIETAIKKSLVCFIAVGTPQGEDGSTDLQYVYAVTESIGKALNGYKVIVDKSTVPVGTAQKITEIIKSKTKEEFDVISNPEFLKQGAAVDDFCKPDRVIIGSNSPRATEIMQELYSSFIPEETPVIITDVKSAEMTKYAANTFLAMKISYINEIAAICEKVGADIEMVRKGLCSDPRIGDKFLYPGIGFGGSCFPKDIKALLKTAKDNDCEYDLLRAIEEVNKNQRLRFVKKILTKYGEDLNGKTFAVWGLAFKPETNDMREAPSITIINELLKRGAKIQAYDPQAFECARFHFKDKITYSNSAYEALQDADCMLLLTEWNEFKHPDFDRIKSMLKTPVIFDGRNQYDTRHLFNKGFEYICTGKPTYDSCYVIA